MFSSIQVKNYKILQDFEYDGFQLINTFVGDSNTGKTTLLEAIFLLSGYSDVRLVDTVFSMRNILLTKTGDLKFIFSNLHISPNKNISISGKYNKRVLNSRYRPLLKSDGELHGLELIYGNNGKSVGKVVLEYNPQKIQLGVPGMKVEQQSPFVIVEKNRVTTKLIKAKMFHASILDNSAGTIVDFSQMIRKQDGLKKLVDILNNVFPEENITNVFNIGGLIEVLTKNHEESLPFSFLGGGVNKMLPILCGMAGNYEVLIIDEIEKTTIN